MTYEVVWADEALASAQVLMGDDADGLRAVFDRVDDLAVDPRPSDSTEWSGSLRRLRVGRYRVLYEIDDAVVRIDVIHLGRGV